MRSRLVRWLVRLLLLILVLLPLSLTWLLGSEAAARWLLTGVTPRYLPQLQVGGVTGNLWSGLSLRQVSFGDGQLVVELDRLDAAWKLTSVLSGEWRIKRLALGRLLLQLPSATSDSTSTQPPDLPLALRIDAFSLQELLVGQGGQQWQVSEINAALSVDPVLRLQQFEAELPDYAARVSGQGEINLLNPDLAHDLSVEWSAELPATGTVKGRGKLIGSLVRTRLQHHLEQPFAVQTEGDLLLAGDRPELNLQGDWREVTWPPKGKAQVSSRSGRFRLSGSPGAITLSAEGELEPAGYPGGSWSLQALVGDAGAAIKALQLDSTAGRVQLQGRVEWDKAPAWQLTIEGSGLDPAVFDPAWPGRLELQASSNGQVTDSGPGGSLDIRQLRGELRGFPVTANARVEFAPKRLQFSQLQLDSAGNRVVASGLAYPKLDLEVSLDAADLAALWPGLNGQAKGEFRIQGNPVSPSIRGQLTGQELVYAVPGEESTARLGAEQLQARLNWDPKSSQAGTSEIRLSRLQTPSGEWQQATVELAGNVSGHQLKLSLMGGPLNLEVKLQGGVSEPAHWSGELQQLLLSPARGAPWSSTASAALDLSPSQASLSPLCLRQGSAEICARGEWSRKAGVAADLKLRSLALESFSPWLPSNLRLKGELEGMARIEGDPADPVAHAELRPGPGVVELPDAGDGPPLQIAYSDARVVVDLKQQVLNADAGFVLQGRGDASLQLRVGAPDQQARRALDGSLKADFPDLELLSGFVPNARISSGSLHLDGTLSGDLRQPQMRGGLKVQDGTLDYPDLGVRFEALNLVAESDRPDRLGIRGSTRSGEGELRLDGEVGLDASAGWPTRLRLTGERVRLVRLPEAQVLASPDLTLQGDRSGLEVTGKVVLPEVTVEVRELPKGSVQVSEDEEIVGVQSADSATRKRSVPLRGNIELLLGDDVRLSGFGLKTRLAGGLRLAFEPGRNEAQGSIDLLEGQYKAYGQDLTLEQGRLLFSGAVDNPGVDLRARRTSSDGEVKAYLELTGTLRKPKTSIRTEPPSSSTDALSYLLTGGPMSQSSGVDSARLLQAAGSLGLSKSLPALQALRQGTGLDELGIKSGAGLEGAALVGGKYLTPDLYVSYAQGLFNPDGALSLKYRLSERFSVESRSGTEQSIDLIYSFEED